MRKIIGLFILALALSVCQAHAEETNVSKTPLLTGEIWMKSSPEEKRAFLFGVDTAIAIEYTIDEEFKAHQKEAKKESGKEKVRKRHRSFLSPFERGWINGLKDVPRKDVIATVDSWYAKHENSLDRPVMQLIWEEIVEPRLAQNRAKGRK